MKIHSQIAKTAIFFAVFICFALPPLFLRSQPGISLSGWDFPFYQCLLFLLSLFLIFLEKELMDLTVCQKKTSVFYKIIFPATFTLCLLFALSLAVNAVSAFTGHKSQLDLSPPSNFPAWIFCLLNFALSAFYEESLYRFYIPEVLQALARRRNDKMTWLLPALTEALTLLLFSFAHLYAGIFAVINASLAHIALRLCFKKTKSIAAGFAAHFSYNLLWLFLNALD